MKKVYLIAVVFALVAGFATYFFASEIDKKSTFKDAEMVTVFVPVADMDRNVTITEDMFLEDAGVFEEKTVVAADVTADVATSKDQLINQVVVYPL